ncbi:MAG: hypothetical protein AB4911_20805 [Oscillochloridaceae bacterium umkhey_bin13]
MPEHRLADGHRLACQTTLRSEGRVQVMTTAEELRRQTLNVINPPTGYERRDHLEPLLENPVRMNLDQLMRYPFNLIATLVRVGPWRFIYPLLDAERWADDASRVTRRMLSGAEQMERAPRATPQLRERAVGEAVERVRSREARPSWAARPAPSPALTAEERIAAAMQALRRAEADLERLGRR